MQSPDEAREGTVETDLVSAWQLHSLAIHSRKAPRLDAWRGWSKGPLTKGIGVGRVF